MSCVLVLESILYLDKILFGCCKQTGVVVFLLRIVKYWYSLESHNRIGFVVVVIIAIVGIIISLALMIFIILF